ncbi:MAG TPA: hypothetical protein VEJ40_04260 [Pseudolabrys sp.]|nr:hypothetical protein [Pseudolabrys sp.]
MSGRRFLQPILAIATLCALNTAAPAADAAKALPGTYENEYGSVSIVKKVNGFAVEISTAEPTRGLWECDFSGSGTLDKTGALVVVYRPEQQNGTATVTLKITLRGNTLTVSETRTTDIADFCGYRGFVHGDYRRKVKH